MRRQRTKQTVSVAVAMLFAAGLTTIVTGATDRLTEEFRSPPSSARPLAWYFWTGDHISKEGLTKDLDAMQSSGIGGGVVMHVSSPTPARKPIPFFQEEWRGAMRHMFEEAGQRQLQFGVHNCPGYSASGGPWVPIEDSQKVLNWTETIVDGPGRLDGPLPKPPVVRDFYREVAVLAYPESPGGGNMLQRYAATVRVSSGGASIAGGELITRNPATAVKVKPTEPVVIELEKPVSVCAFRIHARGADGKAPAIALVATEEAGAWRQVGRVVFAPNSGQITKTVNFPTVTSRRFHIVFSEEYRGLPEIAIGGLGLFTSPLARDPEWKAHFASRVCASEPTWLEENERNRTGAPEESLDAGIPAPPAPESVLDLTDKLRPDGTLDWEMPRGTWTILRFGMTTTGRGPHPAPPGGSGFEVDKLDARAMRAHMEHYIGVIAEDAGSLTGKSFTFSEIDSHEQGFQNWTGDMPEKFRKRWGYEIGPWMVALAGRPLSSLAETDRFLWDFRRAALDLWANEYFGAFAEFLREKGLLAYAEAYGQLEFESSQCYGRLDVPMTEVWWREPKEGACYTMGSGGDNGPVASAANVYGKKRVAVEGFSTSPNEAGWRNHPKAMRSLSTQMFLAGINQIIFHAYPHQAYDTAPGLTLSVWGSQFGRLNSWWPLSRPWHDYLARCQYLLRQGRGVSDFARHLGEEAPESPWLPGVVPAGFRGDGINTESIVNALLVRDGKIVLPSGAEYVALLVETRVMRPELARKLAALVESGATIIAPKPVRSPQFAHWREADSEIRRIADAVWGDCDGKTITERRYGKGRVIWGKNLGTVASEMGMLPDFQSEGAPLGFLHRKDKGFDLYFVANGSEAYSGACLFRIAGRKPELWDPVTGQITRPRFYEATKDGRVRVILDLPPDGTVFVVFREDSPEGLPIALDPATLKTALEISGPWEVEFEPGRGAPPSARFERLACWTENANPGIRYFSGVATYRATFTAPPGLVSHKGRLFLDLGKVADVAQVRINGKDAGGAWAMPARVEVTGLLRNETNELTIEVANRWINRLIGDEQRPDDATFRRDASFGSTGCALAELPDWFPDLAARPQKERIGFPFFKHYARDSPLVPSGLLGPVVLQAETAGGGLTKP